MFCLDTIAQIEKIFGNPETQRAGLISDETNPALPVLRFCLLPVASYDGPVLPYAAKAVPEAFG